MFIVSQTRKSVVNLDVFMGIAAIDNTIQAQAANGLRPDILLGVYPSAERADEVFAIMLKDLFPDDRKFTRDYYYMPEE